MALSTAAATTTAAAPTSAKLRLSQRPGRVLSGGALARCRSSVSSFRISAAASSTDECPVELKSERGVDYSTLRDLLAKGEWEEADNEHRRLLCVLASDEAAERGWVYFTEVPSIPSTDFDTLDNLWFHYSGGKFGFRVQKKIWIGCKRRWSPFFERIDWTTGENKAYRKWPEQFIWTLDAPRGHLPLTNALRGTQLLQAILDHPAFESVTSMSTDYTPQSEPVSSPKAASSSSPPPPSAGDSKPDDKSSKSDKDSLDVDLKSFF